MIDLLEKHKNELRFTLRLKHRETGLYVCENGLISNLHRAMRFDCGLAGASVDEVFCAFCESASWLSLLHKSRSSEYEIESSLNE